MTLSNLYSNSAYDQPAVIIEKKFASSKTYWMSVSSLNTKIIGDFGKNGGGVGRIFSRGLKGNLEQSGRIIVSSPS